MLRKGKRSLFMLVSIFMLSACLSQQKNEFTPPQQRESLQAEQPWPRNGFVAISWHNVEDEAADQRFFRAAVRERAGAFLLRFRKSPSADHQPVKNLFESFKKINRFC